MKLIKKVLSFVCANIFIISINVSIIYIGNKLITEINNTIATSIEKVNNIVPVATHDGFAVYNRDEDVFFKYKYSSDYSKYPYELSTYIPSDEVKKLNENFIVYKSTNDSRYHTIDCERLDNKKTSITKQEAIKQGLNKCYRCNP